MRHSLDIRAGLICDEIRREDNGKAIYIGVYVGEILVKEFPAVLRLSFVLLGKYGSAADGQSGQLEVRIDYNRETSSPQFMVGRVDVPAPSDNMEATILLPDAVLNFDQPTTLTISVTERDGWREVVRKRVAVGAIAATPANT